MPEASQTTVLDVIRRLMPNGTNPRRGGNASWESCPSWPPDAFAVAAYLLEQSGAYSRLGLVGSQSREESHQKTGFAREAIKLGKEWAKSGGWRINGDPPKAVRDIWRDIITEKDELLISEWDRAAAWHGQALRLLACADEAGAGVGFSLSETIDEPAIDPDNLSMYVFWRLGEIRVLRKGDRRIRTDTITQDVDTDFARVLPKALTPNVGCTIRSMSHHFALLPGGRNVRPDWLITGAELKMDYAKSVSPINLLLVPFPYVVNQDDFDIAVPPSPHSDGYFSIIQGWLNPGRKRSVLKDLADLVHILIQEAEKVVSPIHQVVFPEAALTDDLARNLAKLLAKQHANLETVIAGTLGETNSPTEPGYEFFHNSAIQIDLVDQEIATVVWQKKHHRWKLDCSQVEQYELQGILDSNHSWWERLNIYPRQLTFANRRGRIQTVLICEDLARFDPILPFINSVGPNLVIALLMDGPQLERRWPGRYATVLAEDPGSSVLTLTSIGMVERSNRVHKSQSREIALWKDATNRSQELRLEHGSHALALQLLPSSFDQTTMDRRRKEDSATFLKLSPRSVWQVRHPNPPPWISRP